MKATIDKDGNLSIDMMSIVGAMADKDLRALAKYAVFDEVLIKGVLDALVKGEMWTDEDEEPWWFGGETFTRLRMQLLPLLPEITVAAVRRIAQDKKHTEAREARWEKIARDLVLSWPDRAKVSELENKLRDRGLDYSLVTAEQAATYLAEAEAKVAAEKPELEQLRADLAERDALIEGLRAELDGFKAATLMLAESQRG